MKNTSGTSVAINYTFLVVFLAGLSAFGSFVNDMYIPSLPEMTRYFRCSVSTVQLGLTMGMAGLGIGQIILGPVSDKYGRKSILVWSIVLFIAGALVSLLSPTIHFFLICRLIQGLGASGGYFLARTIPADLYGGRQLAKTMAVIGAINGFAPACSPVLGGFISDSFGWKGVFVFLAAFAVLLLCFSPRLKETLSPSSRAKGSLWEAFANYRVLLANRRFMTHTLLKGTSLGLLFAYVSSAPFIIQTHFGFSQIHFGLFMGFNALFIAGGSMVALKFHILKRAAFFGALLLFPAIVAECIVLWSVDRFWAYEALLLPSMFALGMIFTVSNTLAMNEGKTDAGSASAILGVMGYIFGAIVAPLVGIGDIMHSTAIVFIVMAILTVTFAFFSKKIPADLDPN
ncbi:MAG: multidrug effflux MFS transporter [Muribaculaceae bacterium]|nr:multidrug effflux MFS transporter [Muribaculaceae bacterium]